jgi:hypothetical protein
MMAYIFFNTCLGGSGGGSGGTDAYDKLLKLWEKCLNRLMVKGMCTLREAISL